MPSPNHLNICILVLLVCQQAFASSELAVAMQQNEDLNKEKDELRKQVGESRQMAQRKIEQVNAEKARFRDQVAELRNTVHWQLGRIAQLEAENAMMKLQKENEERQCAGKLQALQSENERLRKEIEERSGGDRAASTQPLVVPVNARMMSLMSQYAAPRTAFDSVIAMVQGVCTENGHFLEMIGYITGCIRAGQCMEKDLQDRYGKTFFGCDEQGHLSRINMRKSQLNGRVDLKVIPSTVRTLNFAVNQLHGIMDLQDLRGSSVRFLSIEGNDELKVNLRILEDHNNPISLEALTVSCCQICDYLQIDEPNQGTRNQMIKEWTQKSTLKKLSVRKGNRASCGWYDTFTHDHQVE